MLQMGGNPKAIPPCLTVCWIKRLMEGFMTHKILVVDDEAANLRLLERLFKRDYIVLTASSGSEALRTLQQQEIALLITDQRMSGMTGIELLQHAASIRPQMVRIILTGYTDVDALVEAINC